MTSTTLSTPRLGDPMPDLSLLGTDGTATSLHQHRAGARAVVYFLRAASCPACLRHARALAEMAEQGLLGAQTLILLVAPGDAEQARELRQRVPSPAVTAWASGQAHAAAGLGSFLNIQHSGTFAVDTEGRVLHARTATLPPLSLSHTDLLASLTT